MLHRLLAVLITQLLLLTPLYAQNRDLDGVPLPLSAFEVQSTADHTFAGAWSGLWGHRLKHILVVEKVQPNGNAEVIYAYGNMTSWGISKDWRRYPAKIQGDQLIVSGNGFIATYQKLPSGALMGNFISGRSLSQAVLEPLNLDAAQPRWTTAEYGWIATELNELDQPIKLQTVTFRPTGAGPFPLAIVNHGSTGDGKNPAIAKLTFVDTAIARFLTDRGFLVVFPQRRGRGKSDGLYNEGFRSKRDQGYSCSTDKSLAGAERAIIDLEQIVKSLKKRPDVKSDPILLSGVSRGGILSMAYAGRHPDQVSGVINFVGGWMGERCQNAEEINDALFSQAAIFQNMTLSLYGKDDPFYSINHMKQRFQTYLMSGGQGTFHVFEVPGNNGHALSSAYGLWSFVADDYLKALNSR